MPTSNHASIQESEKEFLSDLELLDDRLLQYEYLLSFTEDLHELPDSQRKDDCKVEGCTSNAWMKLSADQDALVLRMTSDSLIIKGLLGVLTWILDGQTVDEVAAWQPRLLEHPQLKPQLNVDRRRGVDSIIKNIQAFANEKADAMHAQKDEYIAQTIKSQVKTSSLKD